jgi:3-dehydroquinate synthase
LTRKVRIKVTFSSDDRNRGYEILIRDRILDDLAEGTLPLPNASSFVIVSDSNVSKLYGGKLLKGLSRVTKSAELVSFPAGEANKNVETAWKVASELSRLGADRKSMVIALGGGVVGDLAGFVASIYKRGVDYLQIPTTLLAQVDSSIGGKTGVDTTWGKNQLGTFHQPKGVFIDPQILLTLPPQEMLNGVAEITKCAVVADREMFSQLSKLTKFDSEIPREFIVRACRIKAGIVSKDEKETNLRVVLNYGHTVGHAIESSSNFRLRHGTCVILGMMAESWIALTMNILQRTDFEKQSELLRRLYRHSMVDLPILNKEALFKFALTDKKADSLTVRMSLPREIGKMYATEDGNYRVPVSKELFDGSIDYLKKTLSND